MDYYKVLQIDKTATPEEIKKAYRKLSKEYHPDVNQDPDAEEDFKLIKEAYDVLSDPAKRKNYDIFGQSSTMIEEEVQKFLAGHVMDHLLQFDETFFASANLLDHMIQIVEQQDQHQETLRIKANKIVTKLELFIRKISGEKEVEYIIEGFRRKKQNAEMKLKQIQEQREFLKLVLDSLNKMKYK